MKKTALPSFLSPADFFPRASVFDGTWWCSPVERMIVEENQKKRHDAARRGVGQVGISQLIFINGRICEARVRVEVESKPLS